MKKALKAFVAWLDRKFPDRITVTQAEYDALKTAITSLQAVINEGKVVERLGKAESEINKFNASLGFAGGLVQKAGPFQR